MKPPTGMFTEYEESIIAKWESYRLKIGDVPHGSTTRYRMHGCRCDPCRAAVVEYSTKRRERLRGTEPPKHGTKDAYNAYGCRCPRCRRSVSDANRAAYARRRAEPAGPPQHGTMYAYGAYGCRCRECREVGSAYQRARRAAARERRESDGRA